jgi:hypothetical protein
MTALVTVGQIIDDARVYADSPGGANAFISDAKALRLVNLSIREWWDLLVAARGAQHHKQSTTFNTVAGTQYYALTAAYELVQVNLVWSSNDIEIVRPINGVESVQLRNAATWGRYSPKGYEFLVSGVTDPSLRLVPTPTSVVQVEVWVIPAFVAFTLTSQSFDAFNGWEKFIALALAIEMRAAEQNETGDLEALFQRQLERLQTAASNQDAGHPERIQDVSPEDMRGVWQERLPRA